MAAKLTLFTACLAVAALVSASSPAEATGAKVGLEIGVDGEGAFWNPVVDKINVTAVSTDSLASRSGIVAGDEIVSIDGQVVKGRRANDLKRYLDFGPGETRTLGLRHAGGETFEAKLTKPGE